MHYTVKKVIGFPVPSGNVTNQTLPGGEYFNYFSPGLVWLVASRGGTGKRLTFFYSVQTSKGSIAPYFEMILLEKVRTAVAGYMTCSCFSVFETEAACWKKPTTRKKCTKRQQGV